MEEKLQALKSDLVGETLKLIGEDAPKNRFSIVAGKLRMIEDVESEIGILKNARNPKNGRTGV